MMKKFILVPLFLFSVGVSFGADADGDVERYKSHIRYLADEKLEGRRPETKGGELTLEYILSQLGEMEGVSLLDGTGLQPVEFTTRDRFTSKDVSIKSYNVVARIDAPDSVNPDSSYVVIGAHWDHDGIQKVNGKKVFYPGADDNASGTAFVIELARSISQKRDSLKRNVVFVWFTSEELGLKGSRHYVKHSPYSLDKCRAMINFDMVGRMNVKDRGITIRGLGTAHEAVDMFASLPNRDSLDLIWEFRGNGPTDYSSFYKVGIPSFSFSTRRNNVYHTPKDVAETINYDGMVMLDDYLAPLLQKMIYTSDFVLTFKEQ